MCGVLERSWGLGVEKIFFEELFSNLNVQGYGFCSGGMITIAVADNLRSYRTMAKRALKVYNKSNWKSIKLKKFYKVNFHGAGYHYMTFSAQEARSDLFFEVLFVKFVNIGCCSVRSRMMMKSHFPPTLIGTMIVPCLSARKKGLGDGSKADSGGANHGWSTGSDVP